MSIAACDSVLQCARVLARGAHESASWVCGMCMDAAFGAGATLVMVHLDRREVDGEPKSYARCRWCRVASIF